MTAKNLQPINPRLKLGPRPSLTLMIQSGYIQEIWVQKGAPIITLHDYDWGETDPMAIQDGEGLSYSKFTWKEPVWKLGLSIQPRA